MNALNIMWLLNEVNCNTEIDIATRKSDNKDSIVIKTKDFSFSIVEHGTCTLKYLNQEPSVEKDVEYWTMVKGWVKKYYQENF
jgi:hypothetical protein